MLSLTSPTFYSRRAVTVILLLAVTVITLLVMTVITMLVMTNITLLPVGAHARQQEA